MNGNAATVLTRNSKVIVMSEIQKHASRRIYLKGKLAALSIQKNEILFLRIKIEVSVLFVMFRLFVPTA